jgi:hypothetical protein
VKANNRGLPIDMSVVKAVYEKFAPKAAVTAPIEGILAKLATDVYGPSASALMPPLMPCSILHPHNAHCHHQWAETFINAAKRTMPIYLTLTFVPMAVLRFWLLIKHPVDQIQRGLWSVAKSTSFIVRDTRGGHAGRNEMQSAWLKLTFVCLCSVCLSSRRSCRSTCSSCACIDAHS